MRLTGLVSQFVEEPAIRTHVEGRHLVWTDFGWCSAAYPPSLPDGPDHEEGPVTSGARAADLALNVESEAEPTAIRRSRSGRAQGPHLLSAG